MDTKLQKRKEKEQKELRKWEQELQKLQEKGYLWYVIFVVAIVYLADGRAGAVSGIILYSDKNQRDQGRGFEYRYRLRGISYGKNR